MNFALNFIGTVILSLKVSLYKNVGILFRLDLAVASSFLSCAPCGWPTTPWVWSLTAAWPQRPGSANWTSVTWPSWPPLRTVPSPGWTTCAPSRSAPSIWHATSTFRASSNTTARWRICMLSWTTGRKIWARRWAASSPPSSRQSTSVVRHSSPSQLMFSR